MTSAQPTFSVVPAEVQDAGRFVQETAEALVGGIRAADSEISGLMATWRGGAADAYLAGWEEGKKGALEVLDALKAMAELLGVVAVNYADVDDRNSGQLCSLNMGPDTFHQAPAAPAGPALNL